MFTVYKPVSYTHLDVYKRQPLGATRKRMAYMYIDRHYRIVVDIYFFSRSLILLSSQVLVLLNSNLSQTNHPLLSKPNRYRSSDTGTQHRLRMIRPCVPGK